MDPRTSIAPLEDNSLDNAEHCWPTWDGYFDDSFTACLNTSQSPVPMEDHPSRVAWSTGSHSSGATFSPGGSEIASPPTTLLTPIILAEELPKDVRLMKRKAQNRAAQRAHRERQRVRLTGLHEKIDKLQERCKQLQARNQLFEAAFQRFFKDGVALLGSKQESDIMEADHDDFSSDDDRSELGTESHPTPAAPPSAGRRRPGPSRATEQ